MSALARLARAWRALSSCSRACQASDSWAVSLPDESDRLLLSDYDAGLYTAGTYEAKQGDWPPLPDPCVPVTPDVCLAGAALFCPVVDFTAMRKKDGVFPPTGHKLW